MEEAIGVVRGQDELPASPSPTYSVSAGRKGGFSEDPAPARGLSIADPRCAGRVANGRRGWSCDLDCGARYQQVFFEPSRLGVPFTSDPIG